MPERHQMMVIAGLLTASLAACGGPDPAPEQDRRFKAAASRPRGPLPPVTADPGGKLRLEVLDLAGVGEATLVRCPCPGDGHWLLVDAGAADSVSAGGPERFLRALEARVPAGARLEVMVVTHEDPAHVGGGPAVLAGHPVGLYVDNGRAAAADPAWVALEEALAAHPPEHYLNVRRDAAVVLDVDFCPRPDVSAEVLRPAGFGQTRFADEASVIVRVRHGQATALLMGDAGREEEEALLHQPELRERLRCDLLRVGNGGDRGSSTPAFLEVVKPRLAVIACAPPAQGVNKHLGLPKKVVLDRLAAWLEVRPGAAGQARVCDDEAPPPPETDEFGEPLVEEGMIIEAGWVGAWTTIPLQKAVWITAGQGDLRFESDGTRFAPAE